MLRPTFIVIGAQRCGTTWLYENLRLHPEIFLPETKELNFFSDISGNWNKGETWYYDQFKGATEYKCLGEITPEYFVDSNAAKRIRSLLGEIKIICILRDPIERAFSSYKKGLRELRWECSFSEFIENDIDFSVTRGLYAPQIDRYKVEFAEANLLILSYDEIETSPQNFLATVYRFLSVKGDFVSPLIASSFNIGSSSNLLVKALVHARNIFYKLPFGRKLVKSIQKTGVGNYLMKSLLKSQSVKKPNEEFQRFFKIFEKDIEELQRRHNLKFVSNWKKRYE